MVGALDRRIQIGSYTEAKNDSGENLRTWSYGSEIWAQLQPDGGREQLEAEQKVGLIDAIFLIRYRAGITQRNLVKYNSENYDILAIEEVDRKRYLKLITKKKDNESVTST